MSTNHNPGGLLHNGWWPLKLFCKKHVLRMLKTLRSNGAAAQIRNADEEEVCTLFHRERAPTQTILGAEPGEQGAASYTGTACVGACSRRYWHYQLGSPQYLAFPLLICRPKNRPSNPVEIRSNLPQETISIAICLKSSLFAKPSLDL